MKTQPFVHIEDGTANDIQPAGVLPTLADALYIGGQYKSTPAGPDQAENHMFSMLATTHSGASTEFCVLQPLLVRGEASLRFHDIARDACVVSGDNRLNAIFDDVRKGQR